MKTKTSFQDNRSGMTLFVVMGMTLLCAAAVSSVLFTVGARMQRAHKQVDYEKAFYLAEAGLEYVAGIITTGNEVEQWYTGNIGEGSFRAKPKGRRLFGNEREIVIGSEGTYNGTTCKVAMYGVRGVSWARYALWYKMQDPAGLVFTRGEVFRGRVYSTPQMIFYNNSGEAQTHFYDRVWTAAKTIDTKSGAKPIFEKGLILSADKQEIAEVDLEELRLVAEESPNGYVLNGDVTIVLDGKNLRVTNKSGNLDNYSVPIPDDAIIYARKHTYTEDYQDNWGIWRQRTVTEPGDITVSGPNGLDGRMTLVSERNINIVDHIRYASDPRTNPDSDDKLGLIANNDVVVKQYQQEFYSDGSTIPVRNRISVPNNLNIFAHIFCKLGGFGVENYGDRGKQGILYVYGGIANEIRKAVGYTDGRGYRKHYNYDLRFATDPPPHYPRQPEELEWDRWEDRWEEGWEG